MALPNNPRDQYLRTQVETASKEQLVVMLFDGIVRFTEVARKAIEEKRIEDSHHALMRAQAIVMELLCTVDKERGGDVAKNLMGLHAYAFNCLITCNMKKDLSKIDEVQKIYRQLREGWVGAMETLGIGATKAAAAGALPVTAKPAAPVPPKPAGIAPAAKAPAAAPAPQQGAPYPSKGPGGLLAQNKPLGAPVAAPKPVVSSILGAPKPAGLGSIPTMPKPVVPATSATSATSATPAAPKAVAPAAPVAPKAAPAQSAAAISYGMNRTASMMGAYGKTASAAPATPAPVPAPAMSAAAAPAAAPVPPVIKPVINAKQAAMLNAYQAKARTSA